MGMGRCSRPKVKITTRQEAEDFFTDAVEHVRMHFKLDKFILAGHSFGGYVSGCYAIKYP